MNKLRQSPFLFGRFLKTLLIAVITTGLALPSPALALRQPTVEGTGLEELRQTLHVPSTTPSRPATPVRMAAGMEEIPDDDVEEIVGVLTRISETGKQGLVWLVGFSQSRYYSYDIRTTTRGEEVVKAHRVKGASPPRSMSTAMHSLGLAEVSVGRGSLDLHLDDGKYLLKHLPEIARLLQEVSDLHSTSKCNTSGPEDLRWGFKSEAFPRSMIQPAFHGMDLVL
ncbi:MAG: hypothetical protein HY600_06700 [Candidatus Omnitrophica bacterium]|nr:hypothetical protein [Candidatus Omnitrophota bacterium]